MRDVRLGTTDLGVSPICLGTWAFGGDWGDVDEEESKRTIGHAVGRGADITLPIAEVVHDLYDRVATKGGDDTDIAAVSRLYGTRLPASSTALRAERRSR